MHRPSMAGPVFGRQEDQRWKAATPLTMTVSFCIPYATPAPIPPAPTNTPPRWPDTTAVPHPAGQVTVSEPRFAPPLGAFAVPALKKLFCSMGMPVPIDTRLPALGVVTSRPTLTVWAVKLAVMLALFSVPTPPSESVGAVPPAST